MYFLRLMIFNDEDYEQVWLEEKDVKFYDCSNIVLHVFFHNYLDWLVLT